MVDIHSKIYFYALKFILSFSVFIIIIIILNNECYFSISHTYQSLFHWITMLVSCTPLASYFIGFLR